MAITTAICNQFKQDLLAMNVHTAVNTYKLVLVKNGMSGTYNNATVSVGATVDGTGTPSTTLLGTDAVAATGTYGVTGFTLTGFVAGLYTNTGTLDFTSPTAATGTTISAQGAILYNSSQATGKALATYLFAGAPIVSTVGNFTVTMPTPGAATSLIQLT